MILATTLTVTIRADNPPIEHCNETGPHDQLIYCVPGGALITGGTLSGQTNINVVVGQQIIPPSLATAPVFADGVQTNYVYMDCSTSVYTSGGIVYYGDYSFFFVPPIPNSINTPSTNTYTAKVVAYPILYGWLWFGFYGLSATTCSPVVTDTVGTVTVTVWRTDDSDYDGICDMGEAEDGTDPYDPSSVLHILLGYWRFDNTNTWVGEEGQLPITFTNIVGTPGFSGTAVVVDTNGAVLQYRDVETNACTANINLRSGTVALWFKAHWDSASTNSGVGPQGDGRLIEVGAQGASGGWWALGVSAAGTNLYFGTQTNLTSTLTTNLSATINWASNQWHQIVLTYSTNNSSLYLDGFPVMTNGLGVACYPGPTVRAQGFTIGGSASGANQAKGAFDELQTFNYPLDADSVFGQYQMIINSPDYENYVDPNNPNNGALPFAIRISQPANGSVIY